MYLLIRYPRLIDSGPQALSQVWRDVARLWCSVSPPPQLSRATPPRQGSSPSINALRNPRDWVPRAAAAVSLLPASR